MRSTRFTELLPFWKCWLFVWTIFCAFWSKFWEKNWQEGNDRWSSPSPTAGNGQWLWHGIQFTVYCFTIICLSCFWFRIIFFMIIMSELHVFLWKRSESVCLLNYPPSQHTCFLLPRQQHIHLTETNLRLYATNMQSFTTTHSQTKTQCFSECGYPVCVQTSLGSLKLAVLQHLGIAVQKGLKKKFKKRKKRHKYLLQLMDFSVFFLPLFLPGLFPRNELFIVTSAVCDLRWWIFKICTLWLFCVLWLFCLTVHAKHTWNSIQ